MEALSSEKIFKIFENDDLSWRQQEIRQKVQCREHNCKVKDDKNWQRYISSFSVCQQLIQRQFSTMYNIIPMLVYWFQVQTPQLAEEYPEDALGCLTMSSGHLNSNIEITDMENNPIYQDLLKKELELNNKKFQKKVWDDQEVQFLIQLREKGLGWEQISKKIEGTNAQVCKRKFQRSKIEEVKWSKQIDQRVKELCQKESRSWKQIYVILRQQYGVSDRKKLRQIKERYRLYLRSEISRVSWTVDQDLKLLSCVKTVGRKWKKISKIFNCRTQLQVKNRFYGTLLPITKRVLNMMHQNVQN